MELNSLLILLEAAEYLERRDREAEHGYASVLPFDGDFARKKTKAAGLVRKAPNNRSSHNELEKHRRAKLRLYLEQLKQLVPLGPDSTRHTTLSLLKRAKMHIKKLEEQDRRALSIKEQLQREHRFLKRRLEQLSVQSLERVRTDSTGSAVSTDDSEQEVDVEGMEFGPGELCHSGSSSCRLGCPPPPPAGQGPLCCPPLPAGQGPLQGGGAQLPHPGAQRSRPRSVLRFLIIPEVLNIIAANPGGHRVRGLMTTAGSSDPNPGSQEKGRSGPRKEGRRGSPSVCPSVCQST
uniref:BHLH domain-containing protein n=1 Tax=Felis catus TaxID=9685 RepID=A0ABI7YXT5_FELCA